MCISAACLDGGEPASRVERGKAEAAIHTTLSARPPREWVDRRPRRTHTHAIIGPKGHAKRSVSLAGRVTGSGDDDVGRSNAFSAVTSSSL